MSFRSVPLQPTFETVSGKPQNIGSGKGSGASTRHSPFQYSDPMIIMNSRNWGPPMTLIVINVVTTEKEPVMI